MTNQEGLAFEQGVQIFFIQKILAEGYGRAELVGDGAEGDDFFVKWSKIVRDHDGEEGFTRTVTLPENYYQQLQEAKANKGKKGSLDEVSQYYIDAYKLENPEDVPEPYHKLIEDPRFRKIAAMLLADINLGNLMQIEYSATIAGVSKQRDLDFLKTNDAVIIKNAIAQELQKEPLDLTEKDYDSLTKLDLSGKNISDITSLKQCKNLKNLNLKNTGFKNLSSLKEFTNLTELDLGTNQIGDISSLAELTNLTELCLSNNQISDISLLSQMTNLKVLYLSYTQISNISPLSQLTNLKVLYLYNTQISDISALKGLTNLTNLILSNNQISDISALSQLTNLAVLRLHNIQMNNISSLNRLTNLVTLWLGDNQISDISPLSELASLKELDLNNTEINDLTPIKALSKLTSLYASSTQIDNIQAVEKLTNLRLLGITNTKVSDLEPIKDLSKLESLFFSNTVVNNLEPVKGLKQLKVLSLKDTNVNELEPLKELSNLEILKIQNIQVNSLEPIKGLINLKELLLDGCENLTTEQISDLQKTLPDCKIPALAMESLLIGTNYRLFFNPKVPGLSKTKIIRFGQDGVILKGQNKNESSWQIRNGLLELLDSDKKVHSRFRYNPDKNRFDHTNDPDTGSIRKHSMRDQYMLPEK